MEVPQITMIVSILKKMKIAIHDLDDCGVPISIDQQSLASSCSASSIS